MIGRMREWDMSAVEVDEYRPPVVGTGMKVLAWVNTVIGVVGLLGAAGLFVVLMIAMAEEPSGCMGGLGRALALMYGIPATVVLALVSWWWMVAARWQRQGERRGVIVAWCQGVAALLGSGYPALFMVLSRQGDDALNYLASFVLAVSYGVTALYACRPSRWWVVFAVAAVAVASVRSGLLLLN
jgi:hypothetical protein